MLDSMIQLAVINPFLVLLLAEDILGHPLSYLQPSSTPSLAMVGSSSRVIQADIFHQGNTGVPLFSSTFSGSLAPTQPKGKGCF